ncbi:MAG: glycoside hydrolase family 2 [Clostridia bacterium]|nr:glycoside hydrolase family 2 [Clostridia bacterium]
MLQRKEYPRPQFQREEWLSLNGEWEFAFDDQDEGIKKGYDTGKISFPQKINVPFTYQYEASGIGDTACHERVWYRRAFKANLKKRALLCFNGSDYVTDVWVNGKHAITHTGGFAPFSVDITDFLTEDNVLVVRCYDPFDPTIPRGKQSWTNERFGCWYIPNTGIWQSVWIDYFGGDCIEKYQLIPDYDKCSISGEIVTLRNKADEAEIEITFGGKVVKKNRFDLDGKHTRYCIKLMEQNFVDADYAWSPGRPALFNAVFRLYQSGNCVDKAHTRFGLRKVSADGNQICLNNTPLYQRLILDQGYWRESGLTPPSAEAIKKDIELAMAMGFNGARKHQKFEDPYFYYYAEELGFLSWCEMPSAYNFCEEEMKRISQEWNEIVSAARNFTSVICYVPLNESWGVRNIVADSDQQNFARSLYYATKALDNGRLISTNDGWESPETTDILGIHDYAYDSSEFSDKYRADRYDELYPQGRRLMAYGCKYSGQPVLLTEFGGIAMKSDTKGVNWGYNEGSADQDEFYARYDNLLMGIYANKEFQGFCYTQLTDVQQEVNGLLNADHKPKFDLAKIKKLTERNIN